MHAALPRDFFSLTHIGGGKILSFFVLYFFGIVLGQDVWQRVFTARSVRVARSGGVVVGLYCLAYAIAGALIGTAGHVFLPVLPDPDLAFASIVNMVLPPGLRGLLLAASLAAIMSTASACLLAASTVLLEDVYLRLGGGGGTGSVAQSRAVTFVLGVIMTAIACVTSDVIGALSVAYDLLVGALLVPVIGAMLWQRGTSLAALLSITFSGLAVVTLLVLQGINSDAPIYGGLGLSLVIFIGVSLAAPHATVGDTPAASGPTCRRRSIGCVIRRRTSSAVRPTSR